MTPNAMLAWRALMDKLAKSQVGQFASGAGSMLLPSAEQIRDIPQGLGYAARHPIDSMKLLGGGVQDASQDQFEKMFLAPTLSEKIGHGAAGAIPMLGPAAAMAGEEIGAGNTARGMGMAAGLLAPSAYMGLKPMVAEAANLRTALGRVANINKIRGERAGSFANLTPEQAAGARQALANMGEAPGLGPTGSLAQLRDNPNAPVPGMADAYNTAQPGPVLPSRRDALKVGAAAGAGAMLAPKLMEAVAKAPESAALPPRGLAAPSALGREGFYRETKHRAVGYSNPNVVTKLGETPVRDLPYDPNTGKLFGLGESHGSRLDPSIAPNRILDDLNPHGKVEDGVGDRFFLTRTEGVDEAGNPVYGKQVYRLNRGANLREALRSFGEGVKQYELTPFGEIPTSYEGSGGMPTINRVVHSEITPEAALRLNTIEKRQSTNMVLGPRGGASKKVKSIEDITDPDKYVFYKVPDQDGAILKVVASEKATGKGVLADLHNRRLRALNATSRDMVKRGLLDPKDLDMSPRDHLWDTVGAYLEEIPFEEAKAISNNKHGSDYGGLVLEDATPRQGISPRYTKRVSIRLLKDTLEKQIAENKRAAGRKPPPLIAKPEVPPIFQDNPLLNPNLERENPFFSNPMHITRMDFFKRKKK